MNHYLHFFFHILFPLLVAWIYSKREWKKIYGLLLLTMLVDLDHLLATPIWDAHRCSIGFHPLHSYIAIVIYIVLLFIPNTLRILGIGLLLHMMTDGLDCFLMP
jgi:Family of unknown function (DUF6122)